MNQQKQLGTVDGSFSDSGDKLNTFGEERDLNQQTPCPVVETMRPITFVFDFS